MANWGNPWQSAWYQQPATNNPHVYYPPQTYPAHPPAGYWDQQRPFQPDTRGPYYNGEPPRSSKYPALNPVIASDTCLIRYDVRSKPNEGILATTYHTTRMQPATRTHVTHMKLISKAFPWSIDIKLPPGSFVTCEAIWESIHNSLSEHLKDSEWGIILAEDDKKRVEAIEKAAKTRERKDGDKRLKRIDWLGEATMFKGLEKDDAFERKRLLPGDEPCPEIWMIKMGKP